jgi:hypothetical protein
MEILLPEQTTVDDIVFWTAEMSDPESEETARQEPVLFSIGGTRETSSVVAVAGAVCGPATDRCQIFDSSDTSPHPATVGGVDTPSNPLCQAERSRPRFPC